jgi:hypothetical protein
MNAATITHLPENFRRIRLELAREPDHPEGSAEYHYELAAPLLADGRIDVEGWKVHKDNCRVVRFQPGEDQVAGHLLRRPGGSWAFHYHQGADEAGFHFGEEQFRAGEYVSLRSGKEEHTFRVVSVEPV